MMLNKKIGLGDYVGKEIYYNNEWWEMAKEKSLCRKSAREGHSARDFANPKPESLVGKDKPNAIFPTLANEMKIDFVYLCSIGEDMPSEMFTCALNAAENDVRRGKQRIMMVSQSKFICIASHD